MKKWGSIIFSVVAIAANAQNQEIDVPNLVKESFSKRFPSAKNVKWSKEGAGEFEAEFKNMGKEQSANFNQSGEWLETESEIKKSDLPIAVQKTIANEFAAFKVEEVELTETPGGVFYEVEIEKGQLKYEAQINPDGKLLKKRELKESEEDND